MMKMLNTVFASLFFCILFINGYSQPSYVKTSYSDIEYLDKTDSINNDEKLSVFYKIKKAKDNQFLPKDSIYSLVLLKIAKYEIYLNSNYNLAFEYTIKAIEYNKNIHSTDLTFLSNYNLALYYDNEFAYTKALSFCDSVILYYKKPNTYPNIYELNAHWIKANIYLDIGDYQKTVDESNLGLSIASKRNDTTGIIYFLNKKAIALFHENDLHQSFKNAQEAIAWNLQMNFFDLNLSYKTLAKIYEAKNRFDSALFFYTEKEKNSLALNNNSLIVDSYNDLGNFYLTTLHNYEKANQYYYKTIDYANRIKDKKTSFLINAMAFSNLCETSLKQQNLKKAEGFIQQALFYVGIKNKNLLTSIFSNQLITISNKELAIYLLFNKTNLLLKKFKATKQNVYLKACISNTLLADSVITFIRHEQTGEESKLYWRDKTRELYANAIEACYLDSNSAKAFYFFEKSRAALLIDKLNELNASSFLPAMESQKQEAYKIKIIELEQKLSIVSDSSKQFQNAQFQLSNARNDLEQYIKSLEINYPKYYQYKYEDKVDSLKTLQQYLAKNNQSFVDYFMNDSTTYVLVITAATTKFIRLANNQFNKNNLFAFLKICSNKELLNNNYSTFASLSNSIYKEIFQPLNLSKGRVVICTDNVVIPFDAFCTDENGKNFLLNDYSFSYVYSARYLMKHFNTTKATGNFVGFAPVSFAPYLNVNDLKNAADALNKSSNFYNNNKLFSYQNATRDNFLKYASSYSVVSIFSHARADTTDNEPVLYMHDSLIHLSELQLLSNPATQLVLLSACQTNVGKTATGEGIYSLARGFAAAGIPSVSATLWKADEATIYSISEKFNQYLSEGMNKDEALQKAKIDFTKNNNNEKLLPYYWANMILIGNTDAIQLTKSYTNYWWWIALCVSFSIIVIVLLSVRNTFKKA